MPCGNTTQRHFGSRAWPGCDYVQSVCQRGIEWLLDQSEPYTGRRAGPSRSDRPMRGNHLGFLSYLCGAALFLGARRAAVRVRDLLDSPKAMVDRGLGEVHTIRELAEIQLRVRAPPPCHLTQRRRQGCELPLR